MISLPVYNIYIRNVTKNGKNDVQNSSFFEFVKSGVHLGLSEGRGPNFRKGANQYKRKKKRIYVIYR